MISLEKSELVVIYNLDRVDSEPFVDFRKVVIDTDDDGPDETVPGAGTNGICQWFH
jgi:hypothetical protein